MIKGKANVDAKASTKDKPKRTRRTRKTIEVDVEPGIASVCVTHGFKEWVSDGSYGKTIESTCSVSLSCAQDFEQIEKANLTASKLAYNFSLSNGLKLQESMQKKENGDDQMQNVRVRGRGTRGGYY